MKNKSRVDKLLKKLEICYAVDNDREFLECLIDLDDRLKEVESKLKKRKKNKELPKKNIWTVGGEKWLSMS